MSHEITIKDKQFRPFLTQEKIAQVVKSMAERINGDLLNDFPLFLVVLNGAFMFASDLLKEVTIRCEISFIKVASYIGASSSGNLVELIGLTEEINGRTVVIVEDIVDSGTTLDLLILSLTKKNAGPIKVAALLFKPDAYKKQHEINYPGFRIPNNFVVGYGMDYEGMGRNLKEIHASV
jgi:hypoxanthine phosphoribosyltransferase